MKESKEKYLVVPRSKAVRKKNVLLELIVLVEKMPDVSVDRVVGPQDSPKRIIIRGDGASIQKLTERYGDQLFIEPDSPLEMY